METSSHRVRVTESRARDHVRNLSVHVGDMVGVGHRNQQYPQLRWCTPESGHSGWMAECYSEYTSPTEALVTHDYDASQLTVLAGETLEVLDEVGDWLLCRNDSGIQGLVPRRILEDTGPGDS